MTDTIICAVISGACLVACSVIGAKSERRRKKDERRAELRQKESLLSLKLMSATLALATVSANALTGGHNNGNVEAAREAAQHASEEYQEFMQSVTAYEVGK